MADYKETINLPTTEFPMKADLAKREPKFIENWLNQEIYQKIRTKNQGKPKFIMHDGPPYANGHLHLGHAVNKILKDIVCKAKNFSGFDAPFVPGWDCHGLPIELNVEKKQGKAGQKISIPEFRKACRQYAAEQINIQREEFKRLGVFADWQHPYETMNFTYEANIIRALSTIIDNGHLYQGRKPVHWCVDCGSALAEAEVEYKDKSSQAIDVFFPIISTAQLFNQLNLDFDKSQGEVGIVIWTTTPWTLPANQAVAVNGKEIYVLVQAETQLGNRRLILAEALLNGCMKRFSVDNYHVLAEFAGSELENLLCQHPFYQREVPIILGEHVTLDSGTGCVHTAPGHGQDDYLVGIKYQLAIDNPVGDNGCFLANTPIFAGMHINKANPLIIEELNNQGRLLHAEALQHSYPHCWRHKTPLIFRATPQWFISMDQNGLRRDAIQAIFNVEWIPDWGQARIATMIENRPDWCISRQRTWGVPMSLFVHKETGHLHPDTARIMHDVANLVEKNGVDAWYDCDPVTLIGNDAEHYKKINDTLDVWFDSGVSFAAVLMQRPELQFPANLYLEGSDQHRGWFHSSLLASVGMTKNAPYQQVLTHGFTVDANGHKMSKSLGNVVAPDKVIEKLGADILRLWIAATDYRGEMSWSDEIINRISDTYRRIRNTARYFLANLNDFNPETDLVSASQLLYLDQFMLERARLLQQEIIEAYDAYQFHIVYQKIHHFCSIDLGGFYLDIIKDRQYTLPKNHIARRSSQTVMYHMAQALVRWLAPILSFTAEEIYQYLPGSKTESVFLHEWYQQWPSIHKQPLNQADFWEKVIMARDLVNKEIETARAKGSIGSGLEAEVILNADKEHYEILSQLGQELRFVFIVSKITLEQSKLPGVAIKVTATNAEKCVRCWHRVSDVNGNTNYEGLCLRCVSNISGSGEERLFA